MSTPYDLPSLEQSLLADGWLVHAYDYVARSDTPGRVDLGGYAMTLVSPKGEQHQGSGPTRPDALRAACDSAGVLPKDCPLH